MNFERLKRGFEEILPEDDFEDRFDEPCRVKLGVDPTGSELHLGHAVIFNKLRQFQDEGHTVVFLIGDFTARIGDPSGRDKTRPTLSQEEVRENAKTYKNQAFEILDQNRTEVVYNSDWFDDYGVNHVLDLAARTTVARMLERDDFSNRFEQDQPIRLHEFLYPLLQGYDSVEIDSDFEIGGTDQKFNLLMGRKLQDAYLEDKSPQLIGTLPLLVGLDGSKKMSKSYDNHIPLEASPEDMYGQLMSIPDYLVTDYAKLLTDLPQNYINKISSEKQLKNPKKHKKKVAHAIVERFKGEQDAVDAQDYFERTIEANQAPEDDEIESFTVGDSEIWIVDLLDESGLVDSRGEAKRLLNQGGVYLDGEQIEGFDHDILMDQPVTLRIGKHRYKKAVPSE